MKRITSITTAAIVAGGLAAQATAQVGPAPSNIRPPRATPPVSPYLSLLNRDNSMAFNYYQLYRPQVEFRNAYRSLNRDVSTLNSRIDQQQAAFERSQLGPTGHTTRFMDTGSFFPGMRR